MSPPPTGSRSRDCWPAASVPPGVGESIKALSEYPGLATRASPCGPPPPAADQRAANKPGRRPCPLREVEQRPTACHGPEGRWTRISRGVDAQGVQLEARIGRSRSA